MSTTLKPLYGSFTALTITSLNSLTNGSYAGCLVVDNTSALLDDALASVTIKSGGSGTSSTGTVSIFVFSLVDASHYTDSVSGTDATQTPSSPPNLKLIGMGNVVANSTTYYLGLFSIAAAFNGRMPTKWGIVVLNNSGATLDATNCSAGYFPVQDQSV